MNPDIYLSSFFFPLAELNLSDKWTYTVTAMKLQSEPVGPLNYSVTWADTDLRLGHAAKDIV